MSDRQVKLNLGCYDKKIPNFINVDIRPETGCDVIDDIFKLESFETESADLIYACHSLEHADYKEADAALKRWFEVLKPGGVLRLAVPDMEAHFAHYYYHRDLRLLHWRDTEHFYIDDYSQTYYPHLDKVNGKLMSLNMEATK